MHNDRVLAFLVAATEIEDVILIAMYRAHLKNAGDRFETAFDEAVHRLSAAGKNVTIVAPVPSAPYSVPQRAAKIQLRTPGVDVNIEVENYRAQNMEAIGMTDRVANRWGATVVRTSEYLCDDKICHLTFGGKSLYFDSHHLSNFGAAHLVAALGEEAPGLHTPGASRTNERNISSGLAHRRDQREAR